MNQKESKTEKKRKCRRISIRWQILLPVTIIFITGCISIGYSAINSYNEELKETAIKSAESACNMAVSAINADEMVSLKPGDETSSVYMDEVAKLTQIAENCGIKYLYTIYEENHQLYCLLDIDASDNKYMIGDIYDADTYETLSPVFEGGTIKSKDIDNTEDGEHLLTVYKPLYNAKNEIVAIIGCDYDATHVLESRYNIIGYLVVILAATLVFDIVLINLIVGRTMKNINRVESTLYDLVHKDGDLTQTLDIRTGDECELIAKNINELLSYIREVVSNIASNSVVLGLSTEEVEKNVHLAEDKITDVTSVLEQLSAAMQESSASLNQVNESIEYITQAIDDIYVNINKGAESSDAVMKEATDIYEMTKENRVGVMQRVKAMAASLEEKIEKSKAVKKVNALTEDIIEITDQTTLLSLNASIEAARAGDAGKGFAVVADEIGKLANSSANAAVEIKKVNDEVLYSVSELADEAKAMLEFVESVTISGYDTLLDTSKGYESNIGTLNKMLLDFSSQCERLKANIADINEMANAVNIAVEESAKGISSIAESAVELTTGIMDISEKANDNKNISLSLTDEVNKFTYE